MLPLRKSIGPNLSARLESFRKRGLPIGGQLRAAVASWVDFMEWKAQNHAAASEDYIVDVIREHGAVLDPGNVDFIVGRARQRFISPAARVVWNSLLAEMEGMPLVCAVKHAEGLRDLIAAHLGMQDEHQSLNEFVEGFHNIGNSGAIRP